MFGKKKKTNGQPLRQENAAAKIADKIISRQQKLACKLNRWTGNYSRRQQAIAFAVFTLSFGLYCLYILYTAIF